MIDLGLNDDQRQMVGSVVSLLEEMSPVSRLRPGGRPRDVQRDLAGWGWFGVGVSPERDGLGLGIAEEMLLAFEAGRFLLPPAVLATTIAARLCDDAHLPGLLSGDRRAALALAGADGACAFDREGASLLVVLDGDEVQLMAADGFHGRRVTGFDETVATERGDIDRTSRLAAEPAMHSRLLIAAMAAGIARASCDLAVDYAKVREQFGQPIGAFQAIKHICADMGLRAYAAEAQVKMAAAAAADAPASAAFEIAAAALTALRAARDNASDAIQVHGGIGFTAECDAHLYLKRAHLLGSLSGGLDASRKDVLAHRAEGQA